MKYTTFRGIVVAGGLAVAAGAVGLLAWSCKGDDAKTKTSSSAVATSNANANTNANTNANATAAPNPTPPSTAAAPGDPSAMRAVDTAILAKLAAPLGSEKVQDAFAGQPWKVNLYQDAGQARANRVKIDLDRDKNDDEKWSVTYEGDAPKIKRQVSPADDGNYPDEYRLDGGKWVKK